MTYNMSANDARKLENSRPMRQTRLLRWIRWMTGALLLLIIAIPIMAAAQDRQLRFVSTAWSPVHQRARTAAVRPRSGRGGSRTHGDHRRNGHRG